MKLVSLSNNEAAPSGFTHKWIITHADLTAAATTETLQLADNITAGYLVQEAVYALAALEAAKVPCGPINDFAEVFADPQIVARGMQIAPGCFSG
jgi:crotonobetainyl-CoA:carnitine CoA-transferase CaiB-like acyl-CoA transferase